jgi:WD40 repeat protein
LAATASGDFSVQVWDAITGQAIWSLQHKHIVKACDFSPDSTKLATGGHEGILRIFDLTQQEKQKKRVVPWEIPHDAATGSSSKVTIGKSNLLSNIVLMTGCGDGIIRIWDISAVLTNAVNAALLKPFRTLQTDDALPKTPSSGIFSKIASVHFCHLSGAKPCFNGIDAMIAYSCARIGQ